MTASKNPIIRLLHIQDEIEGISEALRGIDQARFVGDYVLRRAAERALLIISEATKSLSNDLLKRFPEVDWAGVIGLGNVLRHEYHTVDADTLWEIVTHKLPELAPVIARMIRDEGR